MFSLFYFVGVPTLQKDMGTPTSRPLLPWPEDFPFPLIVIDESTNVYILFLIFILLNFVFFSGATLSLWLCWRSQIWTLSNPGLDATETLFRFLWLVARGGCPKSGWTSGYRAGMPSQKFRSHTRMFCFTAQLLFPPVLFCLSWHWLVFWIQRVSFDVIWNRSYLINI